MCSLRSGLVSWSLACCYGHRDRFEVVASARDDMPWPCCRLWTVLHRHLFGKSLSSVVSSLVTLLSASVPTIVMLLTSDRHRCRATDCSESSAAGVELDPETSLEMPETLTTLKPK